MMLCFSRLGWPMFINTTKTLNGISTMPTENENENENDNKIESMETSFGSHSLELDKREQLRASHKQLLERNERTKGVLPDDLTKKLDHILYTEWDPIGVHLLEEFDCADEYHDYLPTVVDMVRAGASFSEISDQLMVFESYIKGDDNIRRRCDVAAVLVSSYGPHYSNNPFTPNVNTDTPESAYQSVLDLVTQTRLDAYEQRWDEVCISYEKAIDICNTYLPERSSLVGTCLNNLGHAYSQLGQLEKAQAQFEKALPKLALEKVTEERLYDFCLNNLINNLKYRREFAAAEPFVKILFAYYDSRYEEDELIPVDEKERLDDFMMVDQPPANLRCARVSVEHDGCGQIQNVMTID
jgi:tetratricopeptide (TPR) repeat protein